MSTEDEDQESDSLVIDNGSQMIYAGFAGDDAPSCPIPCVLGSLRHANGMIGMIEKAYYVGDEALAASAKLHLRYPMKDGIITHWDDMERVWHQTFYNQLKIDPAEKNVFLTEALFTPKSQREKTTQIMFETFNVPGMHLRMSFC